SAVPETLLRQLAVGVPFEQLFVASHVDLGGRVGVLTGEVPCPRSGLVESLAGLDRRGLPLRLSGPVVLGAEWPAEDAHDSCSLRFLANSRPSSQAFAPMLSMNSLNSSSRASSEGSFSSSTWATNTRRS